MSGDFDNDGWVDDLAVARETNNDFLIVLEDHGSFTIDAVIQLTFVPKSVFVRDVCLDGFPEWIVSSLNPDDNMLFVRDMLQLYDSDRIQTWDESYKICGESATPKCGIEPPCNPEAMFSGIQECMRALECRRDKCYWAACVLLEGSDLGYVPRYSLWVGQMGTCASVALLERMGCIPPIFFP